MASKGNGGPLNKDLEALLSSAQKANLLLAALGLELITSPAKYEAYLFAEPIIRTAKLMIEQASRELCLRNETYSTVLNIKPSDDLTLILGNLEKEVDKPFSDLVKVLVGESNKKAQVQDENTITSTDESVFHKKISSYRELLRHATTMLASAQKAMATAKLVGWK